MCLWRQHKNQKNMQILIISTPFFGYQESIGNAFKSLGHNVSIETYDEPIHPFKGILKWKRKFATESQRKMLYKKSCDEYNEYIKKVFDKISPDFIFIYNGTILYDDTLDYFRNNKAKVAIWMYDSVLRPDRIQCIDHIDHCDAFFCFENKDVEYFAKQGKTAYFLPLANDTNVYYPQNKIKDIDILFVGTIYTSAHRVKLLEKVAESFPDKKILFYGYYKPFFKNPIKCIFRKYRNIFLNKNITPSEVNDLYARSKVALNIHHAQTFEGANQRLFEACGAKCYQVCDTNPFISSLFKNGEVGLYHNETEMLELLKKGIESDHDKEREAAYNIVIQNHTFEIRAKQILEKVGL